MTCVAFGVASSSFAANPQLSQTIHESEGFAKALGVEWSASLGSFRLTVAEFPHLEVTTKQALVSDVAKTFDILGWFAPIIVKVKILLQRWWEAELDGMTPSLLPFGRPGRVGD